MSGIGLGAALVPQYTQFLIGNFGWRIAYLGLGLLTLIVAFPAVFLFIREPVKAKSTAGGVRAQSPASQDRPPDLEVREALGGRPFWLIACALLLVSDRDPRPGRTYSASLDGQGLFARGGGDPDDRRWPLYDGWAPVVRIPG